MSIKMFLSKFGADNLFFGSKFKGFLCFRRWITVFRIISRSLPMDETSVKDSAYLLVDKSLALLDFTDCVEPGVEPLRGRCSVDIDVLGDRSSSELDLREKIESFVKARSRLSMALLRLSKYALRNC